MKHYLLLLLLSCLIFSANCQSDLVYFDKDKYNLTTSTVLKLDSVVKEIKSTDNEFEEILLIGHTDVDADNSYNQKLSLNRSRAVRDYLESKGIHNRMHIEWKGENETVNKNRNEDEKKWNRRVEIIRNHKPNNTVFDLFQEEFQTFMIDPKYDTVITCKNGTKIFLGKEIFKNIDYFKNITVKIQEFTDKSSFLLSNMTTLTDNNEILESKGMINIEITQNDKQLELKDSKAYGILFKDREFDDNTVLFNSGTENKEVVWKLSEDNKINYNFFRGKWSLDYMIKDSSVRDTVNYFHTTYKRIGENICSITSNYSGYTKTVTFDTNIIDNNTITRELILKSTTMGRINCDKFSNDPSPKIDMVVEYKGDIEPNILMVFDEYSSVLPYSAREGNKLIYRNIPQDKSVRFVGLYYDLDKDLVYFSNVKCETKKDLLLNMELKPASKEEVLASLKGK